jgi:hypothetical protein
VAGELVKDPQKVLGRARANLEKLSSRNPEARRWLEAWRLILDSGALQVLHVLTSVDPSAVELRQNSPFAGTLTPPVRTRVMTSAKAYRDAASRA